MRKPYAPPCLRYPIRNNRMHTDAAARTTVDVQRYSPKVCGVRARLGEAACRSSHHRGCGVGAARRAAAPLPSPPPPSMPSGPESQASGVRPCADAPAATPLGLSAAATYPQPTQRTASAEPPPLRLPPLQCPSRLVGFSPFHSSSLVYLSFGLHLFPL